MTPAALPLHDIHLPPAVSWWPPAPGWWLLCLLLPLAAGGAFFARRRYRRRRALRRRGLQELERLAGAFAAAPDPQRLAGELSVLLRRVCLSRYPRETVAGMTGERWLRFLDQSLPERPFSDGPGRCLIEAPYRRTTTPDGEALLQLCERWLRRFPLTATRQPEELTGGSP